MAELKQLFGVLVVGAREYGMQIVLTPSPSQHSAEASLKYAVSC